MIPILQAFTEGKTIQIRKHGEERYYDSTNSNLNFVLDHYRIKVEPKYRRCRWQEMQKPFGWVKIDEGYEQIWHVNKDTDFNATFKIYT